MALGDESVNSYNLRLCRTCMKEDSDNVVELKTENGWSSLFEFCVGISVNSEHAPRILCEDCANNIKNYAKFKEQCQKSENFWKNMSYNATRNSAKKVEFEQSSNSDNDFVNDEYIKIESPSSPFENCSAFEYDILPNNGSLNEPNEFKEDIDNIYVKEKELHSINTTNDNSALELDHTSKINLNILNDVQKPKKEIISKHDTDLTCQRCKRTYNNKKWLIYHLESCNYTENIGKQPFQENTKSDTIIFSCGLCEFSSKNDDDLNQHLDKHWSSNDLKCKLCNFVGLDLANIITHRYSHHPSKAKIHLCCHICKTRVITSKALQFHYRTHHLKKPGGLCPYCKKQFNTLLQWRRHEKVHASDYICDVCGKKFGYRHSIISHMGVHYNGAKYVCDKCGKAFIRAWNLKIHVSTVHSNSGPVKCSHCNRIFKNQFTYANHQKRVTAVKTLVCDVCSKTFANPNELKTHKFWHSEERPFCCNVCGVSYKANTSLKIHMRKHTGEMPFKCEHCPREFPSPFQLKVHSSVHTGVRAYKCKLCEQSFHYKKRLQMHCLASHKMAAVDH